METTGVHIPVTALKFFSSTPRTERGHIDPLTQIAGPQKKGLKLEVDH
jgi:hypothetical protein